MSDRSPARHRRYRSTRSRMAPAGTVVLPPTGPAPAAFRCWISQPSQSAGGEVAGRCPDQAECGGHRRFRGLRPRDMMAALVAGERNPKVLARLARRTLWEKSTPLEEALGGRFTQH